MNADSQQADLEHKDCAYLLGRAEKNIELAERYLLWVIIAGILIALLAVALNLGVVEISKLTFGGLEFSLKGFFVVRFFTTLAALAALVLLLYFRGLQAQAEAMIEFLATEKKYDNAVIIYIFFQWWQKKDKQAKMLGVLGGIISILIFGLIGFLPLATFFWSLIRNYL